MSAIEAIAAERQRQIVGEGWTPEHDDQHSNGDLALAAALYATPEPLYRIAVRETAEQHSGYPNGEFGAVTWVDPWPFKRRVHVRHDLDVNINAGDKRRKHDRRSNLVKAGALIVAEIERLDRALAKLESRQ